MSNIWHDISPKRISPEDFMAVIEIPAGCKNKYEMDKDTGLLRLDRMCLRRHNFSSNITKETACPRQNICCPRRPPVPV